MDLVTNNLGSHRTPTTELARTASVWNQAISFKHGQARDRRARTIGT